VILVLFIVREACQRDGILAAGVVRIVLVVVVMAVAANGFLIDGTGTMSPRGTGLFSLSLFLPVYKSRRRISTRPASKHDRLI
jgi:hypothetical protein